MSSEALPRQPWLREKPDQSPRILQIIEARREAERLLKSEETPDTQRLIDVLQRLTASINSDPKRDPGQNAQWENQCQNLVAALETDPELENEVLKKRIAHFLDAAKMES